MWERRRRRDDEEEREEEEGGGMRGREEGRKVDVSERRGSGSVRLKGRVGDHVGGRVGDRG